MATLSERPTAQSIILSAGGRLALGACSGQTKRTTSNRCLACSRNLDELQPKSNPGHAALAPVRLSRNSREAFDIKGDGTSAGHDQELVSQTRFTAPLRMTLGTMRRNEPEPLNRSEFFFLVSDSSLRRGKCMIAGKPFCRVEVQARDPAGLGSSLIIRTRCGWRVNDPEMTAAVPDASRSRGPGDGGGGWKGIEGEVVKKTIPDHE
jgi:hypothetical protein